MKISIIKPYSDQDMEYDESSGRYVLTRSFVKSSIGDTFADDGIMDARLKKNSMVVYNHIYASGYSGNRRAVEWLVNGTVGGREFIKDALAAQMAADVATGLNSMGDQPTLDVKTGRAIDQRAMRDAILSQSCKDVLDANMGYIGVNILYPAQFDWWILALAKRYVK